MFEFVLQKLISKKWLIFSLLIGNILLIGLVSSNPIYSQAILQKTLDSTLSDYLAEENDYPGDITLYANISKNDESNYEYLSYFDDVAERLTEDLGLTQVNLINNVKVRFVYIDLENESSQSASITVGYMTDIEEHSDIIYGEMYGSELEDDGSIGVIVSEYMLVNKGLLVGETYTVNNIEDSDGNALTIKIKGVFTNSSDDDIYWVTSPSSYVSQVFMDEDLYNEIFVNGTYANQDMYATYVLQLDYTEMETTDVENMLSVYYDMVDEFESFDSLGISAEFITVFEEHLEQESELSIVLLVLQVPIFILLAAFIYMVSSQILELEQSEIAIFKSRGASKKQIISIYLIQSAVISLISFVVGLPFGYLICNVLGSSNAFLEFVNRTSLPVTISITAVIYALVATVFSIVTMVLPVFKHANIGIVAVKRKKQQKFKLKLWEKTGIDFICIIVSLYGLYTTNLQINYISEMALSGETLDPIIFLYSSVFTIGVGLLSLRIFPWIMKLIFIIGKKIWSPSTYLSFKKVISGNDKQGFIMIFLIMTISIGTFNSVTARTINSNEEKSISYNNGADIVLQQSWSTSEDGTEYTEPSYAIYSEMEGVESYTKVYTNENVKVTLDDITLDNVTLMAIDTKGFGETAYFDEDLLEYHWYEYLNAISQNPNAILMSSNAQEEGGLEVGDSIRYYCSDVQEYVTATIYGFVDYWPTYNSTVTGVTRDGTEAEYNNYLIVANLSQVQAEIGVLPYEIWIKVEDSTTPVYEFIEDNNIYVSTFIDTQSDIIDQKNDPIFQGTNGILTVGFITVLVLCTVGFLIYWILSIVSRQLQFGIYRAMGMSMKEILLMLAHEQICVTGYAIVVGAITGFIASKLYVPLIEITYASAEQAIPLEIIFDVLDSVKIFVVIGFMIILCMSVLSVMISKLKITQVLKLGED